MRQYLLSVMAFLFLISTTELHELIRLPKLVAHYQHHLSENPALSLADFLQLHYTVTHPDDRDDEDDRQLPFKNTAGIIQLDFTAVLSFWPAGIPAPPTGNSCSLYSPEGAPLHRAFSIFHPPRCC